MSEFSASSCCLPTRDNTIVLDKQQMACSSKAAPTFAAGLKWISLAGGTFWMGEDRQGVARPADGEGPVRQVEVAPFALGETAVTVAQFAAFVEATNYQSEAEQFGWSYVFHRHLTAQAKQKARGVSGEAEWWVGVDGASWKQPEGPGSNVKKRLDHPVTHVSWNDAQAFCEWARARLPTEVEWEFAARGGLERKLFPWGDDLVPLDKKGKLQYHMNVWQGKFPSLDTGADGYINTAPARSFLPNGFGFYNLTGNTWEWCDGWFRPAQSRPIRGGSFLCHASYCNRYRCAARTGNTPDSTSSHTGFRIARDG